MLRRIELRGDFDAVGSLVFRLLSETSRLPSIWPELGRVELLGAAGGGTRTRWEMDLEGVPLTWTQEEEADRHRGRLRYRLVSGEPAYLEGDWLVEELSECSSRVWMTVWIDLGGRPGERALARAMARRLRGLLAAARGHLSEAAGPEELTGRALRPTIDPHGEPGGHSHPA